MPLRIRTYLGDILIAIDRIYEYLGEKRDFTLYQQDARTRHAVERNLTIIGEATNRILKIDPTCPLENARRIVDLRNWVSHAYDAIDDATIWAIVCNHLPKLKIDVERMLNEQ